MIREGELIGQLPGERVLAARLQIGRDTLRQALKLLEEGGHVSPRKQGKSRNIIASRQQTEGKSLKKVAFVSPKHLGELPSWMLVEVDILRELLSQNGFQLELINPGVFHLKNPGHRLKKLVDRSNFDVWILYQCPAPLQLWFQKEGLPTIIRGYPHEGVELPFLDEDWDAAAYHAGLTLARRGHRHVGLLMPNTKLAGLAAAERGLRRAIEAEGINGSVHSIVDQMEAASTKRALGNVFQRKNPPTALVATRSRHVITSIGWLASHRLRVPQELSLIALCYEQWFEHLHPEISHYHADPNSLARSLVRRILAVAEGLGETSKKLVIPEYNERNSVSDLSIQR